ncbi:LuxR C-terminal-related transcriptional regulator, partial [Acinetobacter baumannii]
MTAATDAPVLFANGADPAAANDPFHVLTRREREVLERVADALSNKDIARQLDLQEVTIKAHLRQVFRKLSVRNRTQAASL